MGWRQDRIRHLEYQLNYAHDEIAAKDKELSSQRNDIIALRRGVEATFEVTTITSTDARDTRTFASPIDAMHWAADKRIGGAFDRVMLVEVETRRQWLYPNGDPMRPFGG